MSMAFFDVDGTLLPHPSLERRFFWRLLRRAKIPGANCLRWIAGAARLRREFVHSNKEYLRGLGSSVLSEIAMPVPEFFPAAIQCLGWHALRGHTLVLVTGTPAPLAAMVKAALERELMWRGLRTEIFALSTELEVVDGRWSGRVAGPPMFGPQKARAIERFARTRGAPLSCASAYGDHVLDRWMLDSVGRPFAVNPSDALGRVALLRGWPVVTWNPRLRRVAGAGGTLAWRDETAR
jgi:phosphoserine phosphatase